MWSPASAWQSVILDPETVSPAKGDLYITPDGSLEIPSLFMGEG